MHMRKKKWARPELDACPYFIPDPSLYRNRWQTLFPAIQPLHVEFGCGKGVSTAQMIAQEPQYNFVAMDISSDVLGDARRNLEQAASPVTHAFLSRCDLEHAADFFGPEDRVERIILSFCNPWPKRRHEKRRLTHPRQLMQYRTFLDTQGEVYFKTDDDTLWDDSQVYFYVCGFMPVFRTDHLHASGFSPNYVSEHEARYLQEGKHIHFGIYRKAHLPMDLDPLTWQQPNRSDLPPDLFGPF